MSNYCPPKFKFRVGLEVLIPVVMIDIHSQTVLRKGTAEDSSAFGAERIGMKSTESFKLRSIMIAGMVTGVERVARFVPIKLLVVLSLHDLARLFPPHHSDPLYPIPIPSPSGSGPPTPRMNSRL